MKKGHRIVLQIAVGLLCLFFKWLPDFFGWAWLPGWPKFLSGMPLVFIYFPLCYILGEPLRRKKPKYKRFEMAASAVLIVLFAAVAAWASFRESKTNSIEYL
jgi:TRAP-type C4-dicarboxylate transport system permease small subunit